MYWNHKYHKMLTVLIKVLATNIKILLKTNYKLEINIYIK